MTSYRYSNEMIRFVLDRTVPIDPIPRGKKRAIYHETAELFNQMFPNLEKPVGYSQIKYITDHFGNSAEFGNPKGNIIYHDSAKDGASNRANNIPKPSQIATEGKKNKVSVCHHCDGKGFVEVSEEPVDSTSTSPGNTATPVTPYPDLNNVSVGKQLYQTLESSDNFYLTPSTGLCVLPTPSTRPRPSQLSQFPEQKAQYLQNTPMVPPRAGVPEGNRRSNTAMYNVPDDTTAKGIRPMNIARQETATSSQVRPGVGGYNPTALENFSSTPGTTAQGRQNPGMPQRQPTGVSQPYIFTGQNRTAPVNTGMATQSVLGQVSQNQMATTHRRQSLSRVYNGGVTRQTTQLTPGQLVPVSGKTKELMPLARPNSMSPAPGAIIRSGSLKRSRPNEEIVNMRIGDMGYEEAQGPKPVGGEPASKKRMGSAKGKGSDALVSSTKDVSASARAAAGREPTWDKYLDNIINDYFANEAGPSQNQNHSSMGETAVAGPRLMSGNEFQVDPSLLHQNAGPVTSTATVQHSAAQPAKEPQLPDDFDIVQDYLNRFGRDPDYQSDSGDISFADDSFAASQYPDILG
ncbi:uncharacterized protein F4812DRAFT_453113 [Daldinia caldariorum]|uniref:uncharacterized protein n=1 Tax=Daldinia caldariorum TaxID=326644 RepID=UPI00200853A6|nr:uncharacterized protein F4812DRAFT_453113 [Daldinia caldariorum]KAI1464266.1 hypothetical protein F4812DRAFT_453113 [Daldinia caldariorum]